MTDKTAYSGLVRGIASTVAVLGWAFLALQLWLALDTGHANGQPTNLILIDYISFFTILSNLLITLIFTWVAVAPPGPPASVQAAAAAYISIVGIGYNLLLRSLWDPEGLQKVADVMLHDIMPILYLIFWGAFSRRLRSFPWRDASVWLIWPLLYLIYSMVRGQLRGWYPYPFLNPVAYGYPRVISTIIGFLIGFLGTGFVVIALTRLGPVEDSSRIPPG